MLLTQSAIFLVFLFMGGKAQQLEGLLQLDKTSFDKVVNKFEYSLIKFDVGYPTGEKHKNFGTLALQVKHLSSIGYAEKH